MTTGSTNPTATTGTTATEPGAWLREVEALLGLIGGGALARLSQLAANPPKDTAEVFPALAAVHRKLNLHADIRDVFHTARQRGEAAVSNQQSFAATTYERLLAGLVRASDELLDAGVNDPADPWVRLKDFGPKGAERVRVLTDGPNEGWLVGEVEVLPENHPARSVAPIPTESKPLFLALGREGQILWRLSDVRARTAEAAKRELGRQESDRRIAEQRRLQQDREWANSPAGQAGRIRELEAEVARLKNAAGPAG